MLLDELPVCSRISVHNIAGIFPIMVVFLTLTFYKHRPVRNIWQLVIPLTDCEIVTKIGRVAFPLHDEASYSEQ